MQRRCGVIACALAVCFTLPGSAQQVSRAYCGKDGKAHIAYRNNSEEAVDPVVRQIGCEHLTIAADGTTVGWSVLTENCCTSYPIPTSIIVYRKRKQAVISPGQMIWDWRFVDNGARIAVLSGPVHGEAAGAALYDPHNARLLDEWRRKGVPPDWATGWQDKFQEQP